MIVSIAEARTYLGLAGSISDGDLGLLNLVASGAHAAVRKYLRYDPEYRESRTEYYPRVDSRSSENVDATLESDGQRAYLSYEGSDAGDKLILQHLPVRQIRQIYYDEEARYGTAPDAWPDSSLLVEGTDFYPEYDQSGVCLSGIVHKVAGSWSGNPGTCKVVYECGYTPEELNGDADVLDARELKEGVLLAIERAFKTRKLQQKQSLAGWVAGPLTSESLGDYSYSADGASSKFFSLAAYLTPETKEMLDPFRHYGMLLL